MIAAILLLIILLIGSVFLANIFKRKYEETLIVWILGIVFILYVFGLINILKYGVYFVLILTLGMLIYNLIYFIKSKNKKENLKKFISPSMVIFYAFYIFLSILHHNRLMGFWDEFSHWGDCVKFMFDYNAFITSPLSYSLYKDYPPSMALFQYFVEVINGRFSEGLLYLCYHIVVVGMFITIFKNLKWSNKFQIIISIVIIALVPTIFYGYYYSQLHIDAILGMTFGFTIINIMQLKKIDAFEVLKLSLMISFLINLKAIGIFLAVLSLISFIFKILSLNKNKKLKFKIFIPILVILFIIVFTKATWSYNLFINNVDTNHMPDLNLHNLFNALFGIDKSYRQTVATNFWKAICSSNLLGDFISLSMSKIIAIVIFIFGYFITKYKNDKLQFIILFSGLIIYILGLLVAYWFQFSEYEGTALASYERYINIYSIAILIVISLYLVLKNYKRGQLCLVLFLLLYAPFANIPLDKKAEHLKLRLPYIQATNYIKKYVKKGEKVQIISQNNSGFDNLILKYSLRPIIVEQKAGWSLGKRYSTTDIWTLNLAPGTVINSLISQNYDYLYCYNCDGQFKNTYGSIFENKEDIATGNLYKVDKENKILRLVK